MNLYGMRVVARSRKSLSIPWRGSCSIGARAALPSALALIAHDIEHEKCMGFNIVDIKITEAFDLMCNN